MVVDVPIDRRTSLYAAWGDWLPNGCWMLIGSGLAWGCDLTEEYVKINAEYTT